MRATAFALAMILQGAALAAWAQPPAPAVVRVETGEIAGTTIGPARVFHAIPYAAAPVGPLRWRAPQPAPSWAGLRSATAPGPACEQHVPPDGRPNEGGYVGPVSEDCLTLTVTAPLRAGHAPVLVWIPGGGNVAGASDVPTYDGASFARDGVIVVSVNYRLGAFGFFADPRLAAADAPGAPLGNYGLQDQIAALKWVRRNIAAFGGDPGRVTLAGESAGGVDTLRLMTASAARGLFAQAIVESGLGWDRDPDLARREAQSADVLVKLGLPATASAEQLRALPAAAILAAQGARWGPTLDGRLLSLSVPEAFARGVEASVPMIIGSNSFEASLLAAFPGAAARVVGAASPAVQAAYAPDSLEAQQLGWALFGDLAMTAPARWIAARQSTLAPTWLYRFDYVIAAHRTSQPGAHHAGEIPFVFDSQALVPGRAATLTDADRAVTALVHACWTLFVKSGAPRCAAGGRVWPAYDPATDELMEFSVASGVNAHFRKRELDALEAGADLPKP